MEKIKGGKGRHKYKLISGVYLIRNDLNNKVYIGSSDKVGKRLMDHRSELSRNVHVNVHLQRAWNKHGEDSFSAFLVEQVDVPDLIKREQFWIDKLDAVQKGYNLSPTAGSTRGFTFKHSNQSKQKISQSRQGIVFTKEHRKNLSIARRSYKQSRATIEKTRATNTGKKRSSKVRKKLAEIRSNNIEKTNKTVRSKAGRAKSGYKGVYAHRDRWQAKIKVGDKDINLGRFSTKEEAAHNYDYHALQFYDNECYLNFPNFDYTVFTPKNKDPLANKKKAKVSHHTKDGWGRKLNMQQAREIRARHTNEQISIKHLAKEYGVTFATISRILHNQTYCEVNTAKISVTYNPKET